jgi:hypothetical protein
VSGRHAQLLKSLDQSQVERIEQRELLFDADREVGPFFKSRLRAVKLEDHADG